MQVIVLVLAFILFSTSISAVTKVFDGTILSGENIDVDEFTFIITMNKYGSAIFVDAGAMFQTVSLYACKDMDHFEICFVNTTYDDDENDLFAEVKIFRYKPDISITKVANTSELYVGQESEVTITMTNTGDTAEKIIMTDDYPASIQVYDLEGGCQFHENQVFWQGHLDEDEVKECKFIIKGTDELHQSFVAHMKYWDGFRWIDKYSSTMTMDFNPVVSIYTSVVREDYEVDGKTFDFDEELPSLNVGETMRLLINITNDYNERIDVDSFEIHLPPNLEYGSLGHLRFNFINASGNRSSNVWYSDRIDRVSSSLLQWDGRISAGNSKLFIVKLKTTSTGRHTVLINTEYSFDEFNMENRIHENIDVYDPGIAIRMTVDDKSKRFSAPERLDEDDNSIDVESFHPYHITIYAQNRNKYSKLKGIDARIYTELAGFKTIHYTDMEKEGQIIPYSLELIPPPVDSSKKYTMNVSLTYTNEFDEQWQNSTEFEITVEPFEDIDIEWDSSEGDVLEGNEETEIKVSLGNSRLIEIKDVSVRDIIPSDLDVEGIHARKIKLNKDSDTEVFTYRFIAPVVHTETDYNITTIVSFFDSDMKKQFNFSKTTTITVQPLVPDISVDIILTEPDSIYPGTLIPVDYSITNDEEEEIIRDITVNFPIQSEFDLIGPKTFFIDKLDPGERIDIKNIITIRPKVIDDNLELNKTIVQYNDNYGNTFYENSSDESMDVQFASINGPAIFAKTIVPIIINKSTETMITLEIKNNGTAPAILIVEQGEHIWNFTLTDGHTKQLKYPLIYDTEGNYTIPDPIIKLSFQSIDAYTKGKGAEVRVQLLSGPAIEYIEEVSEIIAEELTDIESEKEEMSFEEYEVFSAGLETKQTLRYILAGGAAIFILLFLVGYLYYARRKKSTGPFME